MGGSKGRFTLVGGAGNDVLVVKDGGNSVDGGAGADSIVIPPKFSSTTSLVTDQSDLLNGKPESTPAGGGATAGTSPATTTTPTTGGTPAGGTTPTNGGTPTNPVTGPAFAVTLATADNGGAEPELITAGQMAGFVTSIVLPTGDRGANWSLSFGDGTPARTGHGLPPSEPAHDYDAVGMHTVVLTVTDTQGTVKTSSATVSVGGQPALDITLPATVSGTTVTLDLSSAAVQGATFISTTIDWGDGDVDAGTVPGATASHNYATAAQANHVSYGGAYGIYVGLQTDHGGEAGGYVSVGIDMGHPHARLLIEPPFLDGSSNFAGEQPVGQRIDTTTGSLVLDTQSSSGPTKTIDYGDGDVVTNAKAALPYEHDYSKPGTYPLVFTTTDGVTTDTTKVTVDVVAPEATADIAGLPAKIVAGQQVTVTTSTHVPTGAKITGYLMDWDDGTAATSIIPSSSVPLTFSHTYTQAGGYSPSLVIADDHQEEVGSGEPGVIVTGSAPVIDFDAMSSDGDQFDPNWVGVTAGPSDASFSIWAVPATGETFTSYDLDFGDNSDHVPQPADPDANGVVSGGSPHDYLSPGDYTATLTLKDTAGVTIQRSIDISVTPAMTLSLAISGSALHKTVTITPTVVLPARVVSDYWGLDAEVSAAEPEYQPTIAAPYLPMAGAPTANTYVLTGAQVGDTIHVDIYMDTDHGRAETTQDLVLTS